MHLADYLRQISILLSLPAVLLVAIAAAAIVVLRDWRSALLAYAVLSATVATLLAQVLPTEWALLHAIAGALIVVMLYLSGQQLRRTRPAGGQELRWPQLGSRTLFRLLSVILAGVAFFAVRGQVSFPGISPLFGDALLWLVMMGFLGMALHEEPLHAGLSLLTVLGGFLLLLYSLSQQRLLVGLVEAWQLLLGLAISYLTVSRGLAFDRPPLQQQTASPWWRA